MDTIKKYIDYYKDITFEEIPFNDVDNVIFSIITYLDFSNIITKKNTIKEIGEKYFADLDRKELKNKPLIVRKTIDTFENLYNGKRYGNIKLSDYVKVIDDEKQFGAMIYHLSNNTIYVAFQGTDDSIVGWKEDFELVYKFPVPAQKMAINYINNRVKFYTKNVIVGGHSKGGNLAMTAAMYARPYIKRKIIKIYNNDGPGFRKKQFESKAYQEISSKLTTFIPEESIVGLLLRHSDNYIPIKSGSKGFFQHNPNNWCCYGPVLTKGKISEESKNIEEKLLNWLDLHDDETREKIVKTIFEIFEKNNIVLLGDLNLTKVVQIIRASRELDKESKDLLLKAFKVLFFSDGKDKKTTFE